MLPDDLKEEYSRLFTKKEEDIYLWRLVKAADRLSALIKCIEEEKSGNTEFIKARQSIEESLKENQPEELSLFMEEFFESFLKTLDEQ